MRPTFHCTIPGTPAGDINGVRFEHDVNGRLVSVGPMSDEHVERFSKIAGYEMLDADGGKKAKPGKVVTVVYADGTLAAGPQPLPRFSPGGAEAVRQHEGPPTEEESAAHIESVGASEKADKPKK